MGCPRSEGKRTNGLICPICLQYCPNFVWLLPITPTFYNKGRKHIFFFRRTEHISIYGYMASEWRLAASQGVCYTSRRTLGGTSYSWMGPPWGIDPTNPRTTSRRCTTPSTLNSQRRSNCVLHPLQQDRIPVRARVVCRHNYFISICLSVCYIYIYYYYYYYFFQTTTSMSVFVNARVVNPPGRASTTSRWSTTTCWPRRATTAPSTRPTATDLTVWPQTASGAPSWPSTACCPDRLYTWVSFITSLISAIHVS